MVETKLLNSESGAGFHMIPLDLDNFRFTSGAGGFLFE